MRRDLEEGRRGRKSKSAPFTVVVPGRMEEGERRAKRERKRAEGGAAFGERCEGSGNREGTGSCGRLRRRRGGGWKVV